MAAAYPKQDRTGDDRDRKHQWRGGGTGLTTCFVDPTDNCVVAVGWTPKGKKGVAQKQRGDIIEVKRNNAGWSFWNAHALQPQNGTNGG